MYAVLIYMGAAAAVMVGAQAIRPSAALANSHHRRLYWVGAMTAIGLAGIIASAVIA